MVEKIENKKINLEKSIFMCYFMSLIVPICPFLYRIRYLDVRREGIIFMSGYAKDKKKR